MMTIDHWVACVDVVEFSLLLSELQGVLRPGSNHLSKHAKLSENVLTILVGN